MENKILVKWIDNKAPEKDICIELRKEVFVEEQKFILENELDDDYSIENIATLNLLLYSEGIPAGTARMCLRKEKWYLTRFCVLKEYRGKKLGEKMIEICFEKAKELKIGILNVSAQLYIMKFYKKHGFEEYGEVYYDEHVEHISMSKKF